MVQLVSSGSVFSQIGRIGIAKIGAELSIVLVQCVGLHVLYVVRPNVGEQQREMCGPHRSKNNALGYIPANRPALNLQEDHSGAIGAREIFGRTPPNHGEQQRFGKFRRSRSRFFFFFFPSPSCSAQAFCVGMTDPVVETTVPASADGKSDAVGGGTPVAEGTVPTDEDCSREYEPVVRLAQVVETKTGEEDEEVVFKIRAKLFRFSKELNEWKERGTGDVRVLKHKENRKIRLLMRREKTLKICLNHYVNPDVELTENFGSDRSWMWPGVDYADGERDEALLAIRFRDSESAKLFKGAYDDACQHMSKLLKGSADGNESEDDAEADSDADADAGADAEAEAKATGDAKDDADAQPTATEPSS